MPRGARLPRGALFLLPQLAATCLAACGELRVPGGLLGVVIAACIVAAITGFGIGANDVANAFGTSVGSRSITLRTACMIASVMEFSGALLMGDSVTKTIRGKIIDPKEYEPPGATEGGQREERVQLMLGFLSVQVATASWLIIATYWKLPVSTTHTVIGGLLGFGISTRPSAVVWSEVGRICAAWVTAPILSALSGAAVFYIVRRALLRGPTAYRAVSRWMWVVIVACLWVVFSFLSVKSPPMWTGAFDDAFGKAGSAGGFFKRLAASLAAALLLGLPAHLFVVPRLRRGVDAVPAGAFPWSPPAERGAETAGIELPDPAAAEAEPIKPAAAGYAGARGSLCRSSGARSSLHSFHDAPADELAALCPLPSDEKPDQPGPGGGGGGPSGLEAAYLREDVAERHRRAEVFDDRAEGLFSYLQVLTASFFSFAHGASDTANAVGPLAAVWALHREGSVGEGSAAVWILCVGGGGIVVGLYLWGWRIIAAIGVEMIKVTPSRGFAIQMGAAIIIMLSTVLGIPTSTTHCAVGATVGCGLLEGRRDAVNARLLLKIFCGWGVTLVIASATSAVVYQVLLAAVC